MNEREILIYFYPKNGDGWYDATKDVVWYKDNGNCWRVKFADMNRYYDISFSKMKIYTNPKNIEFAELYYKNSPCFGVSRLICFNGEIYKIFYVNGYTKVAFPNDIKIVKDVLKDDKKAFGVMSYYRRVVEETAKTEEDAFMMSQFDSIDYINEESVLALYFKGKLASNSPKLEHPMISPFGINDSQIKALKMMFSNRISIVEGPPGTGKTQTILNFIANAVMNGLTVAVASNNNSATDNVYEKLDKCGYSFFAAPLGNAENVDEFFANYHSYVPTFFNRKVDARNLKFLFSSLPNYFVNENNKKKAIERLNDLEIEYKHFLSDNEDIDFSKIICHSKWVKSDDFIKLMIRIKENKKLSFWTKLSIKYKFKFGSQFLNLDSDKCLIYLHNLYYLFKIDETKKEISIIENGMNKETFQDRLNSFTRLSKEYFEDFLADKYSNSTMNSYAKDSYKKQFSAFVKDYPVILSSTYSLARCSQKNFLFDYLIVDESSQVNMASAIIAMKVAKNIVVVGDTKQLPQIDDDDFKYRNEELLSRFNVPKAYSYYGHSIMSSLIALYGDKIPRTLLKEHYRCDPHIISFCNKRFYDDELVIYTNSHNHYDYSMKIIKTAPGNFARKNPDGTGLYNQREIDEIKEVLNKELLEDIGIITPYRYQSELIMNQLGNKVESSTIHKFQGREKKTIIFSSVVNEPNEFVGNENLINVAVSRAVDKFILVTSDKVAKSNSGVLSDLINYISYNTEFGSAKDGTVKSIYDLLYSDYQKELEEFRLRHKSKDFDSENLTKELIKSILKEKEFASFGVRMHVSLKDFIFAKWLHLTDEEYKFFMNPNSHADFLIYNKMSRKPVLVIEVDGVSFHEQQKAQRERDIKKDLILEKAGIEILRLKTNESNEEYKIKAALGRYIN